MEGKPSLDLGPYLYGETALVKKMRGGFLDLVANLTSSTNLAI
jgi:hypothetical protein